jgi:hypothetical protein
MFCYCAPPPSLEYVSDIESCCALLCKVLRKGYFICAWTQHVHWHIMHRITRAHCTGVLLLSVEITSRSVMDGCEVNWKCMGTEAKFISFTSWNPSRTSCIVVMYDKEYAITISKRKPLSQYFYTRHLFFLNTALHEFVIQSKNPVCVTLLYVTYFSALLFFFPFLTLLIL